LQRAMGRVSTIPRYLSAGIRIAGLQILAQRHPLQRVRGIALDLVDEQGGVEVGHGALQQDYQRTR
jgi:hypothetical protein